MSRLGLSRDMSRVSQTRRSGCVAVVMSIAVMHEKMGSKWNRLARVFGSLLEAGVTDAVERMNTRQISFSS